MRCKLENSVCEARMSATSSHLQSALVPCSLEHRLIRAQADNAVAKTWGERREQSRLRQVTSSSEAQSALTSC